MAGVCPLISLAAPLKQIGDYPKCPGKKCAWWVSTLNATNDECAVAMLAKMLSEIQAEGSGMSSTMNSIESSIRDVTSPYNSGNSSLSQALSTLTQAVGAIGKVGDFLQQHDMELSTIIKQLANKKGGRDGSP